MRRKRQAYVNMCTSFLRCVDTREFKEKKTVTTVFIKATEKELGLMQDSSYTLS